MSKTSKMLLALAICLGMQILLNLSIQNGSYWSLDYERPSWTPPSYLFKPLWLLVYLGMAISLILVRTKEIFLFSFIFFWLQFVLNLMWLFLFFRLYQHFLGFTVLIALWVILLNTVIAFWKVEKKAGLFLLPYLIWVTFIGLLNYTIWQMNR